MCITWVAKGRRNCETLAKEDAYSGERLAAQFVDGVQAKGAVATLKHFVCNKQEKSRSGYDA